MHSVTYKMWTQVKYVVVDPSEAACYALNFYAEFHCM